MIMNFLKKVPAGMMIVPLLIGAILNTFCSSILQVGSLTTATFSNAGAATAMGIQLVCLGTTLKGRSPFDFQICGWSSNWYCCW